MITPLKAWLNRVTMYRLMLYYLLALTTLIIVLSLLGVLLVPAVDLILVTFYLNLVCWLSNQLFAKLWRVSPNFESQFITGLILSLILGPMTFGSHLPFLTLAATAAMASKYVITWQRRHIFNPAAFGVVLTAVLIGEGASWWVGTPVVLPAVVLGGLIITKKLRRFELVVSFLLASLLLLIVTLIRSGADQLGLDLAQFVIGSPLLFFSFVMLIEPLTSPATSRKRVYFGLSVALIWWFYQMVVPGITYSLELALLTGNIFSRLLQRDPRVTLRLKEKKEIASDTWHFVFDSEQHVSFKAGQYLEWSLPHAHPDSRGTRRFFTIASAPTQPIVELITKITDKPSSFKASLKKMKPGDSLCATAIAGDFVLPSDQKQPLVFIAGGIGVTPFLSMTQYLVDSKQPRPITLLYSNRSPADRVGQDLFDRAAKAIGLKTIYTVTEDIPKNWAGEIGYIDAPMIERAVPDYKKAIFYISGPEPMVEAFIKLLANMKVPKQNIKHDFFPGYTENYQAPTKPA